MRTYAGRLYRDIERKIAGDWQLQEAFRPVAEPIARLLTQNKQDRQKIYARHAPEVECMAKGKARTRFEFGVKASFVVINAHAKGGQFVVGAMACPGLPYDGHTTKNQLAQVERLTGVRVKRAYVDKGYRGHALAQPDVYISQTRGLPSPTIKRELRRRSAIEPASAT
jgi:transposase, IS5 family